MSLMEVAVLIALVLVVAFVAWKTPRRSTGAGRKAQLTLSLMHTRRRLI